MKSVISFRLKILMVFLLMNSCISFEQREQEYFYSRAERIARAMSDEELAGQLMIVSLRRDVSGTVREHQVTEADSVSLAIINELNPGGILLYGENFTTVSDTQKLVRTLQRETVIPLWIAVDEEGGVISRLDKASEINNVSFLSNLDIASLGDPGLAFGKGQVIGAELSELGVNMNFSPIADINTNPDNPIIGARAYGSDPHQAGEFVRNEVHGLQLEGVAAVVKHFPGHGDTKKDSHYGAVTVTHSMERLLEVELVPFLAGIEADAIGIMVGHIGVPEVTGSKIPATFSPVLLKDLLRGKMGYQGLVISDSMGMGAITIDEKERDAVVEALLAGIDVILNPPHPLEARDSILKALKSGILKREELESSVIRILLAKQKTGLWNPLLGSEAVQIETEIGSEVLKTLAGDAQTDF